VLTKLNLPAEESLEEGKDIYRNENQTGCESNKFF
jgi:hypothetical protein